MWPLVAIASGAFWALCFGREALVVAPWIALVPLVLLLDRSRPLAAGFLHGLGYWLAAIPWIQPTLQSYGGLPPWAAGLALGAACAYLALYNALFGAVGARIWRRGPIPAILGLPALWVAIETLRASGPLGFPWNLAAYSLSQVPGALPSSAWVGSWGLSFLVVAVNVGLALLVAGRAWKPAVAALATAAVLLVAGAVAGRGAQGPEASQSPAAARQIALLQPNSPISSQWDEELVRENYLRIVEQAGTVCDRGQGLLIWPESAAWPFSYQRHRQLRRDVRALAARGCPVVLNSTVREGEDSYNAVYLVTGGRADQRYEKRLLVPFGEHMPLPSWLPAIPTVARGVGGFTAGTGEKLLDWETERLGLSICFEIVFANQVARQVRRGATLLVTVTNDGWYGDSTAPWQHFRAARFRAAENRRTVLRAAITGVSGIIGPDGSVLARLGVGERGVLSTAVAGSTRLTFFSRFPWLVPVLCWGMIPFAIFRFHRD